MGAVHEADLKVDQSPTRRSSHRVTDHDLKVHLPLARYLSGDPWVRRCGGEKDRTSFRHPSSALAENPSDRDTIPLARLGCS